MLGWQASEAAEFLDTNETAVNSLLRRARSAIAIADLEAIASSPSEVEQELLAGYVDAFQRYDVDALTAVIREDASQSMPPYDMWLSGRADVLAWWFGPGIECRGNRLIPAADANGSMAIGQYKPNASGDALDPWALQVLEWKDGAVSELTFFLDAPQLFPLFNLPPRLAS